MFRRTNVCALTTEIPCWWRENLSGIRWYSNSDIILLFSLLFSNERKGNENAMNLIWKQTLFVEHFLLDKKKKKKRISAGIWFCWSSLAKELKKTAIKQENKNSSTFYIGNPKTTTLITSLVWSYPVVEAQTSLLRAFHGARKEREETAFYESADCKIIRHFLIVSSLCFKARPSARPLIRKLIFYSHASNIHFHKRDVHLASFWKWEFLELGSGIFS